MNRTFRLLLLISVAASVPMALIGCGGGSSGGSGSFGRVSGRVVQAATRAVTDPVTVTIDGTNLSTVVSADGSFTFDRVPVGLRTLIARTLKSAVAVVASVEAGSETNVGSIGLRDAGQLSGLVTSSVSGLPIADARIAVTEVVLTDTADSRPHPVRITRTDGNGSYTITGLPIGSYLVSVTAEGFESASLTVDISAGSTTPGDAKLSPAPPAEKGSMSGTAYLVFDSGDKSPLAGVLVRVTTNDDPGWMQPMPARATAAGGAEVSFFDRPGLPPNRRELYTFTDDKGAYTIDGIPAGQYSAVAVRPGLEPDRKSVTISGTTVTQVDFALHLRKPKVGIVEGTVTNSATKAPIANATVTVGYRFPPPMMWTGATGGRAIMETGASNSVYVNPDDFVMSTQTDANGKYQLKAPAGERTLDVYADGFQFKETEVTVPNGGTVKVDLALDPEPGKVNLTGHVYTAGSNGAILPVANARVFADFQGYQGGEGASGVAKDSANAGSAMPFMRLSATTDAEGSYTLPLRPGAYFVSALKDNLYADGISVNVTSDTTQDLVLKPFPGPPTPPDRS